MKPLEKKMVQSSLVCAPKGSVIFLMGLFRAADGLLTARHNKDLGKQKTKEGLYAMYNNIIPLLEILIIMPATMSIITFVTGKNPLMHDAVSRVTAAMICVLVMMSVCISLRMAQIRKDCCADFDFENHMESGGRLFKIPVCADARNSLRKTGIGSFDWLNGKVECWIIDKIGNDGNRLGDEGENEGLTVTDFLAKLIQWPFFVALFTMNVIELPLRLLVDVLGCIKHQSFDKKEFEGTLKFIKQDMAFNLYKIAEPFSKILPDSYEDKVKTYFKDTIVAAQSLDKRMA